MCGRFTLRTEPAEFWPAEQLSLFQPRYNIAPTQEVPIVRRPAAEAQLSQAAWGLVPSWADDIKIGYRMINARSETVAEKPAFRDAFEKRRCLVLADGYYEWKTIGKQKQPFFIRFPDDRVFAFAGLWESWRGTKEDRRNPPLETCTIITTEANRLTADVHDRMPAILRPEEYEYWLDIDFRSQEKLQEMLRPFAADEMDLYPVSRFVNKVGNESPECVEPIRVRTQRELF